MGTLRMVNEFINMVKLLFQDAESSFYFNGNMMTSFQIRRGVKQGWPLPPYLFQLVSEILNIMIKWMTNRGEMHRVFLLGGEREQTSPRMLITLPYLWQEMKIVSTKQWNFSINSSSYLGWSPIGIWAWPFGTIPWTSDPAVWKIHVEMGSRNGDFNVVGMAIGLHLNIKNVNSFVTNKIHKKIKFWGIVHLPLAGKQSSSAHCWALPHGSSSLYAQGQLGQFVNAKTFSKTIYGLVRTTRRGQELVGQIAAQGGR